jgi:hypothetical protein
VALLAVSGLETVTLGIAVAGVLLGAASLAWQIISWRREGPQVRVEAGFAFPTYGAKLGNGHARITARNLGRSAIGLNACGYELPDKLGTVPITQPASFSTALPCTLQGGHQADFYVEAHEFRGRLRAIPFSGRIRAYVDVATGERVHSRRFRLKL